MDANDLYRSHTLSRRAASSSVPVVADALAVSRSKLGPGRERKECRNLVCGARWAINAKNFALPMYSAWIWRVSVSDKKNMNTLQDRHLFRLVVIVHLLL